MSTRLKEKIAKEIDALSEEQQERLLQWIQVVRRGQVNPPTGELGLKRPFTREEFYEDALTHRL